MNIFIKRLCSFAFAAAILAGCSTPPPKIEPAAAPNKPEMTIQIASINLANLNKRIERTNIHNLARILKNEQVDIFAVQGISRYPGVSTRVDFVNELTSTAEWNNIFGEMTNISGKQTGNAIFSVYPILSHQNVSWEKVRATSFDAALQATIDAVARPLTCISTQLPAKATTREQEQCSQLIASMSSDAAHQPSIVSGNLPAVTSFRTANAFAEVPSPESAKNTIAKIWYSDIPAIQLLGARSVETDFGTLVIVRFGLMRQQHH